MEYITELTSLFFDIGLFAMATFAALMAILFFSWLAIVILVEVGIRMIEIWEGIKCGFKRQRNK